MAALITDPSLEKELIAERRATGADRYDEVWEGTYVMAPLANDEHQDLAGGITTVLTIVVQWTGRGKVRPGVNVSDRKVRWKDNYRCPDVAVFLKGTKAVNRRTHWRGGPDFAVEIVSPGDRTLEKIPFYEKVGTRELLVIDRDPWCLTLYRLQEGRLLEAGRSTADDAAPLRSEVVPLTWRLSAGEPQPEIEIRHHDGTQQWLLRTGRDSH